VFAARYEVGALGPALLDEVVVLEPEVLAAQVAGDATAVTAVGDGAMRYRAVLHDAGATIREDVVVPSPARALRIVQRRGAAGEAPLHHRDVHPTYLREADAVANFAVRPGAP
jgi:hypothetical protein